MERPGSTICRFMLLTDQIGRAASNPADVLSVECDSMFVLPARRSSPPVSHVCQDDPCPLSCCCNPQLSIKCKCKLMQSFASAMAWTTLYTYTNSSMQTNIDRWTCEPDMMPAGNRQQKATTRKQDACPRSEQLTGTYTLQEATGILQIHPINNLGQERPANNRQAKRQRLYPIHKIDTRIPLDSATLPKHIVHNAVIRLLCSFLQLPSSARSSVSSLLGSAAVVWGAAPLLLLHGLHTFGRLAPARRGKLASQLAV